jgi:hypothetical protein
MLLTGSLASDLGDFMIPSSKSEEEAMLVLSTIGKKLEPEQAKQWKQALQWFQDCCKEEGKIFWQVIPGMNAKDLVVWGYVLKTQQLRNIASTKSGEERRLLLDFADSVSKEAKDILENRRKGSRGELAPRATR